MNNLSLSPLEEQLRQNKAALRQLKATLDEKLAKHEGLPSYARAKAQLERHYNRKVEIILSNMKTYRYAMLEQRKLADSLLRRKQFKKLQLSASEIRKLEEAQAALATTQDGFHAPCRDIAMHVWHEVNELARHDHWVGRTFFAKMVRSAVYSYIEAALSLAEFYSKIQSASDDGYTNSRIRRIQTRREENTRQRFEAQMLSAEALLCWMHTERNIDMELIEDNIMYMYEKKRSEELDDKIQYTLTRLNLTEGNAMAKKLSAARKRLKLRQIRRELAKYKRMYGNQGYTDYDSAGNYTAALSNKAKERIRAKKARRIESVRKRTTREFNRKQAFMDAIEWDIERLINRVENDQRIAMDWGLVNIGIFPKIVNKAIEAVEAQIVECIARSEGVLEDANGNVIRTYAYFTDEKRMEYDDLAEEYSDVLIAKLKPAVTKMEELMAQRRASGETKLDHSGVLIWCESMFGTQLPDSYYGSRG